MLLFKKIFLIVLSQLVAFTYFDLKAQNKASEIVYLQTDRTAYITGESIYFKLYVLDAATKKCSTLSKVGYVIIRAANWAPSLKILVKVDAGMANGSIVLPDTLTSGVYQIVVYTSIMRNLGEAHFFHKEITIANRFDKSLDFKLIETHQKDTFQFQLPDSGLQIKTDKAVYGMREKVHVKLSKINSKANVSVSVFEEPKIPSTYNTISEVLGNSSIISNSKHPLTYYSPEIKGKILRGTVIDVKTNQRIKNAIVLLSCIDTVPNLQYALTNSGGLFQMLLSDYYNGKELFLTIKDVPEDQNWQIKIEDEFTLSEKWNPLLVSDDENYKDFIIKSQNIVYINKSYKLNTDSNGTHLIDNKLICPWFYHCPAVTTLTADFVPLNNFPEISIELLHHLRIVKENGKFHAQIYNDLMGGFDERNPAIFLDGVFVDDINKIIGLGSEQIKKIDLITVERAFGDLLFSGIISITSNTNEMINSKPASYSLRYKNDDLNTGKKFIAINPYTIQNNIPFIKQLLYWNPNLELNGDGDTSFEFYTSDNLTKYSIKIEGVSEDGVPISASSSIQVTNQINVADK